jgi:hypothetical protein
VTATIKDVRHLAIEARNLELEKSTLEDRLKQVNTRLSRIYYSELPAIMDEAETDSLGLPAEGNFPAYDLELVKEIKANISADWDDEKRTAAIGWLDENGHGDLVKTEVRAFFPREDREEAHKFAEEAKRADPGKARVEVKESVHNATLTAWLKELFRDGKPIPPLDVIGGVIAKRASLKQRKE